MGCDAGVAAGFEVLACSSVASAANEPFGSCELFAALVAVLTVAAEVPTLDARKLTGAPATVVTVVVRAAPSQYAQVNAVWPER